MCWTSSCRLQFDCRTPSSCLIYSASLGGEELAYQAVICINKHILTGGIILSMTAKGKKLNALRYQRQSQRAEWSLFLIHLSESLIFCTLASLFSLMKNASEM